MIYVMSDLHGCFDKYLKMLEKIDLRADDTLYVLGDVVDRGPDGIKILLDMAERKNIVFLRGNHDQRALEVLTCLFDPKADFNEDVLTEVIRLWREDGGNTTLDQFTRASSEDRKIVLKYIRTSGLSTEITVGGKKYLLAHTVPEKEIMLENNDFRPCALICIRPVLLWLYKF